MEMLLKKEIGTAKAILAEILLRYRLSGNSHPSSDKNPGPDLALAEMRDWLPFSHHRETFDAHLVWRQGGLDINPRVNAP